MSGARAPATAQDFGDSDTAGTSIEATIQIPVNKDQQTKIISDIAAMQNIQYSQFSLRGELENIDRIYQREKDWTEDQVKARIANRRGDAKQMQNVTLPIVMPQVNAALTYLTEVFLTGYPIFPVVADAPNEAAALQMESIVQENVQTAGWVPELLKFFRDGLKYNFHGIECDWRQRTNWTIDNNITNTTGVGAKKTLWQGNVLKRMDLYNTFWDTRVHPNEIHSEGEFAGYTEIYTRVRFKKYMNSLFGKIPVQSIIDALNSQPVQGSTGSSLNAPWGYYVPIVNPMPFYNRSGGFNWLNWATNTPALKNGANYANAYSVTRCYARIIPSDYDFRVPAKNTPQVWRFIIINGQIVLLAERLTNIHNFLPIFFGQVIDDGLDYQTKSFAQNVEDMQDIGTALWNGYIASKRRLVGDRVLYDPSRVSEKNINSENPAAKIPVRSNMYGKPISDAVYQFPYKDDNTNSLIEGASAVTQMANLINGQNPATQGQFVKGNKTRHEYEDVMGHGNGQNMMMALSIEYQILTPLKEVIKLNILQFQQPGEVYNTGKKTTVSINPVDLRKSSVHFKVSDGLIPSDKITGDDLLQTVVQQIGSSPQLAGEYDIGDMFTYLMQTQGLDLSPFEKTPAQKQYEQALGAWQQAAANAAKSGQQFSSPQPQPSPQLQQEMQAKQQGQPPKATASGQALEQTQG